MLYESNIRPDDTLIAVGGGGAGDSRARDVWLLQVSAPWTERPREDISQVNFIRYFRKLRHFSVES